MQLLDEVPMIWGSCYMLYCMHMVRAASHYITLILGLDQRNIMRFEGERKAGCSEQNSRSVPLDLLHRLRGRVPQCAQPACVSSKYKIPLLFLTSSHMFFFSLTRLCTGRLCLWWLVRPWGRSESRTTPRWCPCTRPVCSSTWQDSYFGTWVIYY